MMKNSPPPGTSVRTLRVVYTPEFPPNIPAFTTGELEGPAGPVDPGIDDPNDRFLIRILGRSIVVHRADIDEVQ